MSFHDFANRMYGRSFMHERRRVHAHRCEKCGRDVPCDMTTCPGYKQANSYKVAERDRFLCLVCVHVSFNGLAVACPSGRVS